MRCHSEELYSQNREREEKIQFLHLEFLVREMRSDRRSQSAGIRHRYGSIFCVSAPFITSDGLQQVSSLHLTMDAKTGKIFGHAKLPVEIYLEVLDRLNVRDISFKAPLTLLNLSLTSSANAQIVRDWAANAGAKERRLIRTVRRKSGIPCWGTTDLAIICRLRGGLCMACNNRAKLFSTDDNMMDIQLCRPCEVTYFPKISLARIKTAYVVNENIAGNKSIEQLLRATGCTSHKIKGGVVYYDWEDVHRRIVRKKMVQLSPDFHSESIFNPTLTNEDFGLYYPPNQRETEASADRWPMQIAWDEICALEGLERTAPSTLPPHQVEIYSLNYFRYLFDPKWRDDMSKEQKFIEAMKIIKHWGTEPLWYFRPWATEKLPVKIPPECAEGFLLPSPTAIRMDGKLERYQFICNKLLFLMRCVPGILFNPTLYIKLQYDAVVDPLPPRTPNSIATFPRRKSPAGGNSEDFDMEISKYDNDIDIEFVRRRDELDFMACTLEEMPLYESDVSRSDIISFRGGNISVRSRCMVDRYSCFTRVNFIDGTLSTFGWRPCRCDWCFATETLECKDIQCIKKDAENT